MSAVILVPRLSEHVIPRALDQILIAKTEYPGTSVKFQEGTLLSSVRDRLVVDALTHPDKPEWALFLDSDMEFPPSLLQRMIDRAERNDIKVLSGCYFSKDVDNPNPIVSSYLGILNDSPSFLPLSEEVSTFLEKHSMKAIGQNSAYIDAPDEEALIKVGGVGGGCLLVHREVLEKMEPPYFSFERGCSEDYYFCYDKDTEIVTKSGLKYLKDVTYGDHLLTLSDDGIMEYRQPTRLIKKKEEKLLKFKSKRIDMMVSKDQHLLVGYNPNDKLRGGKARPIDFIRADVINSKLWDRQSRYYIKTNGGTWIGNNLDTIEIGSKSISTELFVQFMAWYLSEGCVNKDDTGIIICQSFDKNLDKCNEITTLITDMGFTPKSYKDKIIFYDKDLHDYCLQFGKSHDKFVPDVIKNLPTEMTLLFLNTYIKGDGHVRPTGERFFMTSSDQMKDDLVELIIKSEGSFSFNRHEGNMTKFSNGKSYETRPVWHIYWGTRERAYLRKAEEVDYNDYVYDVEVPNHRIFVVRNGKGCWSSNCLKVAEMGYDVWCDLSVQCGHYTIAATSFRTFMSKYPKDQLQFRATVGNTHIHSMAEYMGESHLWVIDQIRNNKDNYGAFHRIGSDISPTFANTLNSISRVINSGEGKTALIYKGSAGTETAILAQNKWTVVQYDTNEDLLNYSAHYIKHMKLEDKATVTNELSGEYDFIVVFDGFKHTIDFEKELTELATRRLKKNGVMAMFCAPSVRKGEFNHSESWYKVINKLPLVQVAPILYQRT